MEVESAPLKKTHSHHEENKGCSNWGMITFILGLVAGTFSALLCKMAYDTKSVGIDGTEKVFAKPIMMLTLMFAGMAPALLFWVIQQRMLPPEERDVIPMRTVAILIIPSLCDLFCTLLLLVAQLYITASLWQMMRGSIIIITALLKRYALGHRLKMHMWLGVGFITAAMILVASTSFVGPSADAGNSKDPRVGIMLVLVGCIAQGVQCEYRLSLEYVSYHRLTYCLLLRLNRCVRGEGHVCGQRTSPGKHCCLLSNIPYCVLLYLPTSYITRLMSLLPSTLLCLLGGDRLRGPVGYRAEHPGGLPPGLPGARPGQRLIREPLRRHRHDHQQPAAAGKRLPGLPIVCILYFVVFFNILLINKRLTLKHSTVYSIPHHTALL